ncbi:protein terminal ear1 [Sesamum alatum]|uniref:Protein terminal ear1 n=1 Tax=Sesamum alatum TaxID=300844 RepID=A0AAE2CPF5_9LAMI|nr:protein terminal ear1 [Sesamum alatum]
MCIKLPRTLNPNAEEWRPTALQPPFQPHHLLPYAPHSQLPPAVPPPVQVVPFTAAPPQNLLSQLQPYYQAHPLLSYLGFVPFNVHSQQQCVSFPADESFYKLAAKKSVCGVETKDLGCGNEINLLVEDTENYYKEKTVESAPVNVVKKKGTRRKFPPRLQRALSSTFSVDKKPRSVRQEWRPRKSANPESYEGSADAGASLPPPPASGDDFSHPSKTTVMIKNIPNQLGRDFMLKFLDECCKAYSLEYDFLYLPMDFRRKGNLGYAFVNFTSGIAALEFGKTLHNYKWEMGCTDRGPITSKKICEVTWARIQGKEALIRRFKNSSFSCDRLDFLPVVLHPPRNGSNPNPCAPVVLGKINRPMASSKTY